MRDYERMRKDGIRLVGECEVALKRIRETTSEKFPSLTMSVTWLDEVEAKMKRARWLLRQSELHARKKMTVERAARRLPVITDAVWCRLDSDLRTQILLVARKTDVVNRPGAHLVRYVLQFNVELAANIARRLAIATQPPKVRSDQAS